MEERIVILGEINEFFIAFCKYLISKELEVYVALSKNQGLSKLKDIEGKISLIKYNDEIKFILTSIEPKSIYNLYGPINNNDLKGLIEKFFLKNILLLEGLRESNNSLLINVIERTERDAEGKPLSIYTEIVDFLDKVNKFYRDNYKVEVRTKYRDEYENTIKYKIL